MYDSASELARELKVDKGTIIRWIKEGKIKAKKHKFRKHYKIFEKINKKSIKITRQKTWTKQEDNLIVLDNIDDKKLAKMTGRTVNAIRVHKTILRKKGIL